MEQGGVEFLIGHRFTFPRVQQRLSGQSLWLRFERVRDLRRSGRADRSVERLGDAQQPRPNHRIELRVSAVAPERRRTRVHADPGGRGRKEQLPGTVRAVPAVRLNPECWRPLFLLRCTEHCVQHPQRRHVSAVSPSFWRGIHLYSGDRRRRGVEADSIRIRCRRICATRAWLYRRDLRPTVSIGVQKATFRHTFEFVLSTARPLTTAQYTVNGADAFKVGFNIYRRLR